MSRHWLPSSDSAPVRGLGINIAACKLDLENIIAGVCVKRRVEREGKVWKGGASVLKLLWKLFESNLRVFNKKLEHYIMGDYYNIGACLPTAHDNLHTTNCLVC